MVVCGKAYMETEGMLSDIHNGCVSISMGVMLIGLVTL